MLRSGPRPSLDAGAPRVIADKTGPNVWESEKPLLHGSGLAPFLGLPKNASQVRELIDNSSKWELNR